MFNCAPSTISSVLKNKDHWNSIDSKHTSLKKIRSAKYNSLEDAIFLWMATQRSKSIPVHAYNITEKSMELAQKAGIFNFKASNRWLSGFLNRFDIKYRRKLHGESGGIDEDLIEEWLEKKKKIISSYHPNDLYNVDETGLFYEVLPNGSYITKAEVDVHGVKSSKKRVTLVLCTNSTGTDKLKLQLINSSKRPRCFKNLKYEDLPVNYNYQKRHGCQQIFSQNS